MDAVLREVERKHRMERHFLTSLLLDNALEDIRSEAREMSEDERQKRLLELKDERDVLDLDEKGKAVKVRLHTAINWADFVSW